MAKAPPWQRPSSAPVPPQGAPGGSGQLGTPRGEAGPLGAQPLPRLLELATSQAAYFLPLTIQVEGLRALLDGLRPPVQGAVHLSHWEAEWKAHLAAAAVAAPTAEAAGGAG